MSKGGSDKVKVTEQERALSETAATEFNRFLEMDVPIQNEAIARQSGLRWNESSGGYDIDAGGPLDRDGNIQTNAIASNTSNEAAFTSALARSDPNRVAQAHEVNKAGAVQGANAAVNEQVGQQTSYLKGLGNLAAMGTGEQQQAIDSQTQLAANAQSDAITSAQQSAQQSAARGALAGQVAGTAVGVGLHRGGYLDTQTPKTPTSSVQDYTLQPIS